MPRDGLGPGARRSARSVAAGGLPVLAHFGEAPTRVELLRELIDAGLGGLEVYYRTFDAATTAAVGEVAAALGLVATGGTDYHGDTGTYAEAHAGLWVPPEVGDERCSDRRGATAGGSAEPGVGLGLFLHERRAQLDRRLSARRRARRLSASTKTLKPIAA